MQGTLQNYLKLSCGSYKTGTVLDGDGLTSLVLYYIYIPQQLLLICASVPTGVYIILTLDK